MRNLTQDLTDSRVEITSVSNGFRVRINFDQCSLSNDEYVFQSKAELFLFLSRHFSFENISEIKNDAPKISARDLLK